MVNPNSVPSLLSGWSLKTSPCSYLAICTLTALMVRVIHCIFKDLCARFGEYGEELAAYPFVKLFGLTLNGFREKELSDLWLGFFIGLAEILFYPVLIFTGNLSAIGGWLAIKTAGGWELWHKHPIAFNRFLVANLINVAIAYVIAFLLFY